MFKLSCQGGRGFGRIGVILWRKRLSGYSVFARPLEVEQDSRLTKRGRKAGLFGGSSAARGSEKNVMRNTWRRLVPALLLAAGMNATVEAAVPSSPQGFITGNAFYDISGTAVSDLTNSVKFPESPDDVFFFPYFEWNATGDIFVAPGELGDNYGGQIAGYFYPPTTGNYIFWLAADDNAELYLSTDSDPANKKLIARETEWSNAREYTVSGGGSDLTAKDSSQFTETEWPEMDPFWGGALITLQAGEPYYIEALFKEGTGGDFLSVAVQDPEFLVDWFSPIPGEFLSSDRAAGPATISQQPQDRTAPERGSATFSVRADGTPPYSFQWQRNGEDIPDATNSTFTVSNAAMSDNGAAYTVVVTGAEGEATSEEAILTVTPDTEAPRLVSAGGGAGLSEVVLSFSEALDEASASTAANYEISSADGPLEVTGASVTGSQVILTTAPQTLGTKYTVVVNNVQDTAATPNAVAADSSAVFFPTGELREVDGMIVFEVENYDRNLDGLWVRNTTRGTPSGGASMVVPNGAGGDEFATRLEYDVEFATAGTYYVWYRASSDSGDDDSAWFHLDGDRPFERATGNAASMTGFNGDADFVWYSDSQDGPDPFTVDIFPAGLHTVGIARREDGAFIDKMILTTDPDFVPTGAGPAETREGAPGLPTVTLSAPNAGEVLTEGEDVTLSAEAAGSSGLEIVRVEYTANGMLVGESTEEPFDFVWSDAPSGIYGIQAAAYDELGQVAVTEEVVIEIEPSNPSGAAIAWVSFHPADDVPSADAADPDAGFTEAPDVGYTELLRANGHEVTRIVTSGTPNAGLLNAFDLVIISRSVPSGDYQDPPETAAWNGLTAPTMILGGYVLRSSRLGFTSGTTMEDTEDTIALTAMDPNHPIFEGIELDGSGTMVDGFANVVMHTNMVTLAEELQRGVSVNMDPILSGTVLATVGTASDPTFGGMVIGEWQEGELMNTAAGDVLGGHRLVFLTGSREHDGLTSEGAGIYDLTETGAELFLNAVEYMSGIEGVPQGPTPTISVSRTAEGMSITFEGMLQSADSVTGTWSDVTGAESPHEVDATEGMKFYRAKQ